MENCLVTKLQGTVNNDNLPYYGFVAIPFEINKGDRLCGDMIDSDWGVGTYRVLDGTYDGATEFQKGGAYLNTNKLVPSDPNKQYCTVLIPKYDVNVLQSPLSSVSLGTPAVDVSFLKYNKHNTIELYINKQSLINCDKLVEVFSKITAIGLMESYALDGSQIDLSSLGLNGKLTTINLANPRGALYKGSLNNLGYSTETLKNGTNLFPATNNVSFSVEAFVANARLAGVTSGTNDSFKYVGACNATFNGESIENIETNTLSWTASTITFNGVTINA